jgi:hypothetical protein
MTHSSKAVHNEQQKHQAQRIEETPKASKDDTETRAWPTVKKQFSGVEQPASGKQVNRTPNRP